MQPGKVPTSSATAAIATPRALSQLQVLLGLLGLCGELLDVVLELTLVVGLGLAVGVCGR